MTDATSPRTPEVAIKRLQATEHVLETAGVATHYWEYGSAPKSAQAGRGTIVAVHGFRGDHHGLEAVVAQLPHEHVIAPDLPGFGLSPAFRFHPHDLDGYVGWLRAFLTALAPKGPVTLLGHSFGSIVVAAAVAGGCEPDSLILINPIGAPALKGPRAIGTFAAVGYYRFGSWLPERIGLALLRNRLIVRAMSQMMAKTRDPQLRAWIHRQHDLYFSAFATRRSVLEAFQASISHDISEFAARIRQPTLLIAAEKDDITPLSAQYRLVTLFPNAQLEVIPEVGHLIHYETPRQAARFITRFLHETNTGEGAVIAVDGDDEPGQDAVGSRSARPLRVLFDARYTRLGRHDGISRYTASLAAELAKFAEVELLISDERQCEMLPERPWHRVPSPTSPLEPFVARHVNRVRMAGGRLPDVVFTPMQTMGSRGRNYPLVLTVHDLIYYRYRTPPRTMPWFVRVVWRLFHLSWWPERLLLNGADAVVTVSDTTRALIAEHHLTKRPVSIVGNAPAEPSAAALAAAPGHKPENEPRSVVHMGQFLPYKNVEALARAAAFLPGYEVRFMSAASLGEQERLRALSSPVGAPQLVFRNGADDADYERELLRATALVSTSWDEGFGIPLVEAMRLGVPVVVSDIPIFREVAGSAGIYVDPADPGDVARGIRTLEDPEEWQRRSLAAFQEAERFSWADSARALLAALESAVQNSRFRN